MSNEQTKSGEVPGTPQLGSSIGNKVFLKRGYENQYPKSKGYYGIITDIIPAANYNQDAKYQVDVFNGERLVDMITTTHDNLICHEAN